MHPIIPLFIWVAAFVAAITGYIKNILIIFNEFDILTTGEVVVRALGIPVPIIGAIVGYF